jgi:putative tricarboxylic transport membrane protein
MKQTRKLHPGERLISWLLLLFSLLVFHQAYRISGFSGLNTPGSFPLLAALVMVVCTLFLVLENRALGRKNRDRKTEAALVAGKLLPPKVVLFTLMIVGYMLLLQPLGFLLCTLLFLTLSILYLGRVKVLSAVLIATGSTGAIHVVFSYLFQVVLP